MARQRRTAWATALVLTAALVAPVASAPMADAKPSKPTPTAKAVRDAKAAAAAATRAVLAARAAQSTAQSRLDLLDSRLETAIEHLNAARAAADAAAGVLAHRQQVSAQATQTSITAQLSVDRLASDSYKAGTDLSGGLGELAAVLDSTPDGLQGLVAGINALGQVASGRRKDVEQAANLHLAALQAEAAERVPRGPEQLHHARDVGGREGRARRRLQAGAKKGRRRGQPPELPWRRCCRCVCSCCGGANCCGCDNGCCCCCCC